MHKTDIAIATICWAREPGEEALLRKALTQLATLEIPVFITDGGSNEDFLDFLSGFAHFTVLQPEGKGVWAQAKTSVKDAYEAGNKFILYTEPDKFHFFQGALPTFINQAPDDGKVGVVLASRSEAGFATFPKFQQTTETTINQCCAEVISQKVDYTYGPFLFNQKLVPYLDFINEDIGWGWRPFVFGMAHRLGYYIDYFEADFNCPPDQQEDSKAERVYRMKQLYQNIQGLVLAATVNLEK